MASERHDTAFVVGAILGGIGGAVAALFSVPRSGAETRAELAERLEPVSRRLASITSGVGGASDAARRVTSRVVVLGRGEDVETRDDDAAVRGPVADGLLLLPDPTEPAPVVPAEEDDGNRPRDIAEARRARADDVR